MILHPTPNPFSIWSKNADVVLDYRNRVDLKNKYSAGDISVATDFTYTNATHPETGVSGAIDASTDYWSSAIKLANSGFYTVDLKDTLAINGISICLLQGVTQSADISYSVDGTSWTAIKSYSGVTHYTVDYTGFTPSMARYVKVNISGSVGKVGLTEINIFRSAETYEDYAVNVIPYGYTASDAANPDFWVSEGVTPFFTGYKSQRALYMYDNDGSNKELSKTGYTASSIKTLEFKLRTKGFSSNGCVQFRLLLGSTNVFRMAVFPTGILRYYNGTAWNNIGAGSVSVPLDTWKTIRVVANASTNVAKIYVSNVLIGTATKETSSTTTMNGFLFASGGGATVGDKALFDDVELYGTTPVSLATDNVETKKDSIVINTQSNKTVVESLSDTTSIKPVRKTAMKITMSPNPAFETVNLTAKNSSKGQIDIYIKDMTGKRVKTLRYFADDQSFSVSLPISELPLGVYIITVKQNNSVVQTKLLK